jgi:hypothetical protein
MKQIEQAKVTPLFIPVGFTTRDVSLPQHPFVQLAHSGAMRQLDKRVLREETSTANTASNKYLLPHYQPPPSGVFVSPQRYKIHPRLLWRGQHDALQPRTLTHS